MVSQCELTLISCACEISPCFSVTAVRCRFHASVFIEEEVQGEAYAHNKKEAKKKAAEDTIKRFLPANYVSI